jgi:epsilon-lactone hydrolase
MIRAPRKETIMIWLVVLLLIVATIWAVARFHLSGPDLSRFDQPVTPPLNQSPSAANERVVARVEALARDARQHKGRERLTRLREAMDALGAEADLSGVRITQVVAGQPAEWVTPASGPVTGRLLYLHGGAFSMGSPLSHRSITAELARRTGVAVLAVAYRLMPEHARTEGIEDARTAYGWMLANGPDGPGSAETPLFVAGDSAGGNLTLMLVAWVRDEIRAGARGLRQVDGAIALSPLTDATLASPSIRRNIDSDPMLGPMMKLLSRVPRSVLLWSSWVSSRLPPNDPRLSPVHGDLTNLPPVLIQASEAELLIDDARRYANKASAAGSPAEIQTWRGMVHVWQAFGPDLPETDQAFTGMQDFIVRQIEARNRPTLADAVDSRSELP